MSRASDAHRLDSSSINPESLITLPDVPTLAILSLLPLRQLIVNVPLVHRNLAPIREKALKGTQRLLLHLGKQKKIKEEHIDSRLALPFAPHHVDSTEKPLVSDADTWSECDQLHLTTLDHKAVDKLSSLMPGIVHLQVLISHAHFSVLQQLAILLAYWAPTLQTLQLHVGQLFFNEGRGQRAPRFIVSSNLRLLIQGINRKFVAIQHLTLDIDNLMDNPYFVDEFLFGGKTRELLDLSIISRLKEFYFYPGKYRKNKSFLFDTLKKYAPEKATNIELGNNFNGIVNYLANSSPSTMTGLKPELLLSLPDELTVAILSLLPLQQLIVNLPLVHPRLAPIREKALKETQRLVLLIGDKIWSTEVKIGSRLALSFSSSTVPLVSDPYWSELDQLHLANLDYRSVEQLSSLMPGIVHLKVAISHACVSVLPLLAILLFHWAPSLQTLQLHVGRLLSTESHSERPGLQRAPRSVVIFSLRLLLQSIDPKFVALQHLTMDVGRLTNDAKFANEFLFGSPICVPLSLPILGQLREFYLHLGKCDNGKTFLLEALKKHATEKLTSFGLNGVRFENIKDLASSLLFITARKPELLIGLPDGPTVAILSLLPFQQVFNFPLVHPNLVPFCESILIATQRLVLHIGDQKKIKALQFDSPLRLPFADQLVDSTGALLNPDTDTPFNTLHFSTLSSQTVKQLTSLMPAIVHLKVVISHAPISVLLQLTDLLSHWAPTLQTLKVISGNFDFAAIPSLETRQVATSNLRHLIQGINQLVALQTLSLDIGKGLYLNYDEFVRGVQTGVPLNLPILGQLRQFYFSLGIWTSAPGFLLKQLVKHATEKLTSIGLGGNLDGILKNAAESAFAPRFTMVKLNDLPLRKHIPFLPSFTNLTVYSFNWEQLNALELVDHLRALSTLSHLQFLQIYGFSPVSHPIPASFNDLPSLPSVKVLEIKISEPHDNLQAPYWWTLFPSVEILKVTHYADVTPYLSQLLAPLAVLLSLKKIFYQRANQFENIAEFTPQGEFVCIHEFIG